MRCGGWPLTACRLESHDKRFGVGLLNGSLGGEADPKHGGVMPAWGRIPALV